MRTLWTALIVVFAGCDTAAAAGGDYTCTNAPSIVYPKGLPTGAACTKNADCAYGGCAMSALQLSGHVTATEGVCTKNCACGSAASQCSTDDSDANNLHYSCIKAVGATTSECAVKCTTLDDCTKVNPRFNTCTESSDLFGTGVKVCTIQ